MHEKTSKCKQVNINKILNKLMQKYPFNPFEIMNKKDPFKTLVSCIISQRSRDQQTLKISKNLFSNANAPQEILSLGYKKLQRIFKSAGFYKQKSRNILAICKILLAKYHGKVPDTMKELLSLPGVGRKTANIVLSFAFNKPAIAVDTHVHRISNRLGILKTSNPIDTEFTLQKLIPKDKWSIINKTFVLHGQNLCKPLRPQCNKCFLTKLCRKIGVVKI